MKRSALAIAVSILTGSLVASLSAFGLVKLLGGSAETALSIAPESVTAAVAMGISQQLGGLPSLTAVMVILTGILGAMLGPIGEISRRHVPPGNRQNRLASPAYTIWRYPD